LRWAPSQRVEDKKRKPEKDNLEKQIYEKSSEFFHDAPVDHSRPYYSKYGIADGIQAIKVVRAHAAEWGISPERVVLTGFSAGAILTSAVVLQSEARPNYAAPIYGGPFNEVPPIPQGLPPIFLAVAQDDASAEPLVTRFYDALKAAGYKPELHVFSAGGHGFGMRKQGKSSDHWIDEFYFWLESLGLTRPTK
jgi:acetyl esterase/lipase